MNFLTENKIEYYSDLESKIADILTAHDAAARAVKEVENAWRIYRCSLSTQRRIGS